MSSMEEKPELKGGHPPAVKAGGMRITQNKSSLKEEHSKVTKDGEELEDTVNASLKVSTSPPKSTLVSGAPMRGFADFPAEAVQSYHDKPVPTHEQRPMNVATHHNINQPRK